MRVCAEDEPVLCLGLGVARYPAFGIEDVGVKVDVWVV